MKLSEALKIVLDGFVDEIPPRHAMTETFEAVKRVDKLYDTIVELENDGRSFDEAERAERDEAGGC